MRWKQSTYPGIYGFNENHPAFKTNRSSGVVTISVNPNMRSAGAATININPARDTPQRPMPVDERRIWYLIGTW